MKHGLIFDLDGTLVDSLRGITSSVNYALTKSDLPLHSLESVRSFIGNGARILIERAATSAAEEQLLALEQAFKSHYDSSWQGGTFPYTGITDVLQTLQAHSYPLAVLSNKPHPFTLAIVRKFFPTIHFATILGQRSGIPHKPDPAGALEIASSFKIDPRNCITIGDSTVDIQTAHNAGMKAIAVLWGFHDREQLIASKADFLAENPTDLLQIIESL